MDPIRDLDIIHNELRLKDIEFMQRAIEDLEKVLKRSNDKQVKLEHECCLKVMEWLEEGKDVRLGEWKAAEVEILNTFQLLSAKPVVYLVRGRRPPGGFNRDSDLKHALCPLGGPPGEFDREGLPAQEEQVARQNPRMVTPNRTPTAASTGPTTFALLFLGFRVQEHGGGDPILPFSGVLEAKLADMPEDEEAQYCKANETMSALPKIIKTGFSAIHLIYFFTCGPDEVSSKPNLNFTWAVGSVSPSLFVSLTSNRPYRAPHWCRNTHLVSYIQFFMDDRFLFFPTDICMSKLSVPAFRFSFFRCGVGRSANTQKLRKLRVPFTPISKKDSFVRK